MPLVVLPSSNTIQFLSISETLEFTNLPWLQLCGSALLSLGTNEAKLFVCRINTFLFQLPTSWQTLVSSSLMRTSSLLDLWWLSQFLQVWVNHFLQKKNKIGPILSQAMMLLRMVSCSPVWSWLVSSSSVVASSLSSPLLTGQTLSGASSGNAGIFEIVMKRLPLWQNDCVISILKTNFLVHYN